MATVTYKGSHPEPSFAIRNFAPGRRVPVHIDYAGDREFRGWSSMEDYRGSTRNESVCLAQGMPRPVSVWAALFCAAARRPGGPWFTVRLAPGEWEQARRAAPWLRKVRHAVALCSRDELERLRACEVRPYNAIAGRGDGEVRYNMDPDPAPPAPRRANEEDRWPSTD